MPPPSWICSSRPTAAIMSRITFSFFGRPAIAPLRSTMCRRFAPCAAQCFAIATGSSENTVAEFISPCFRRTQRPSFKSIAGMMSTGVLASLGKASGTPVHEVGEKLQAGGGAFFGVELDGKNVIPRHRAGKGGTVHPSPADQRRVARLQVVAVHEIEARAVGDALPHRMGPRLDDLVPPHMGDFAAGRDEPRHVPREQPH